MLASLQSVVRRVTEETRGAEIAEAAAVLPLMFMVLLGIFWFGEAFSIYGAITRAAQEGARAGALPYCSTCGGNNALTQYAANAATATQAALTQSNLNYNLAKWPTSPPAFSTCNATTVSCATGGSSNFCIQAPVQFFNVTAGSTGVCGMSVTFQYPFQMYLPFTSLNKQLIWIPASASVRMETQ